MAEFQDVMRQWVRVRKATASSAEENVLSVYPLEKYNDVLIADIEKNVMSWAAEHPEPEYPTWGEWFTRIGLYHDTPSANINANDLVELLFKPIHADIAEKLGLQPKEG